MKILIIYLIIGTIWTFISENATNQYKKGKYEEININDSSDEINKIDWSLSLRLTFILTWPIGIFQVIKNLFIK